MISPGNANAINAAVLILLGGWGYLDSESPTALIPVFFGVILLVLSQGVRNENKVQAHVAVVLTLVVLLALFMPFKARISDGDTMGMIRVGAMILSSIVAMIAFIMSFRKARLARK